MMLMNPLPQGKCIYFLPFLFSMSQTSTTINPTLLIKHLDSLFIRFSLAAKHLSNSTTSFFSQQTVCDKTVISKWKKLRY